MSSRRGTNSPKKAPYDEEHVNAMMKERFAWTFYELYNPGKFTLQTYGTPKSSCDAPREDYFETPLASYSLEEELKSLYVYEKESLAEYNDTFQSVVNEMDKPENKITLEFIPLNYKNYKKKNSFDESREEWNKKLQESADRRAAIAKSEKEMVNQKKRAAQHAAYINQQREKRISKKKGVSHV